MTDPEPIPPGHPLVKMENCLINPHVASYGFPAFQKLRTTAAEIVVLAMRRAEAAQYRQWRKGVDGEPTCAEHARTNDEGRGQGVRDATDARWFAAVAASLRREGVGAVCRRARGELLLEQSRVGETARRPGRYFAGSGWHNTGGDRTWIAPELDTFFPDATFAQYWQPRQLDMSDYAVERVGGGCQLSREMTLHLARPNRDVESSADQVVWAGGQSAALRSATWRRVARSVQYAGYTQRVALESLSARFEPQPGASASGT